ncbi:MAG: helix-turn-helix domain-containing protein [Gammaproteobacteria bacterium]|nr:helix-turn-helix domain-containing protein [Gammaproteobacteria bacterium]
MTVTHEQAYAVFKETREQRGLSVAEVANALHLTVTMIEQIEAGEFIQRHLAPVFIRGYIRSYAKYLSLPDNIVEEIVRTLDSGAPAPSTIKKSPPVYKKQLIQFNIKKVFTYLIIVVILIVFASIWHSGKQAENTASQPATIDAPIKSDEAIAIEPMDTSSQAEEYIASQPQDEPIEPEDENNAIQSEENAPLTPEQDVVTAPESAPPQPTEISPPVEAPPAPVVAAPTPIKKQPAPPPKVTTPAAPTQPEVVDAQETA